MVVVDFVLTMMDSLMIMCVTNFQIKIRDMLIPTSRQKRMEVMAVDFFVRKPKGGLVVLGL